MFHIKFGVSFPKIAVFLGKNAKFKCKKPKNTSYRTQNSRMGPPKPTYGPWAPNSIVFLLLALSFYFITAYMDETYETKKAVGDKMALWRTFCKKSQNGA